MITVVGTGAGVWMGVGLGVMAGVGDVGVAMGTAWDISVGTAANVGIGEGVGVGSDFGGKVGLGVAVDSGPVQAANISAHTHNHSKGERIARIIKPLIRTSTCCVSREHPLVLRLVYYVSLAGGDGGCPDYIVYHVYLV